jgi:hypothetical protein
MDGDEYQSDVRSALPGRARWQADLLLLLFS